MQQPLKCNVAGGEPAARRNKYRKGQEAPSVPGHKETCQDQDPPVEFVNTQEFLDLTRLLRGVAHGIRPFDATLADEIPLACLRAQVREFGPEGFWR